jgi:RimJ/RimL family protein N-acetyltransferase
MCYRIAISVVVQLCAYLIWPILVVCTAIAVIVEHLCTTLLHRRSRSHPSSEDMCGTTNVHALSEQSLVAAVRSLHNVSLHNVSRHTCLPRLALETGAGCHQATHGEQAFLFCTPRLCIRPFCYSDAEEWCNFLADATVWQHIRPPKARQAALEFLDDNIRLYLQDAPCGRFRVCELVSGTFIGCVGVLRMDDRKGVHVGYALHRQFWGRGYAQELVVHARAYFFGTGMIGQTIYAETNPENVASEHVLYRTGFTLEGSSGDGASESHVFSYANPVTG